MGPRRSRRRPHMPRPLRGRGRSYRRPAIDPPPPTTLVLGPRLVRQRPDSATSNALTTSQPAVDRPQEPKAGLVATKAARPPVDNRYAPPLHNRRRERLAIRSVALALAIAVAVLALTACGSPSKTSSIPKTTTQGTSPTKPSQNQKVCARTLQVIRPLAPAAASNNRKRMVAAARDTFPRLLSLAKEPGISTGLRKALNQEAASLQAIVNGGPGNLSATLHGVKTQLATACK
jgi:hypothetical protein